MRRLLPIVVLTASIAGCGAATPDPVAGCKGLRTTAQSATGLGFSGIGADQRYICAHLGSPSKIVRDLGAVAWVYQNAIVRFGDGRVLSTESTNDPNGITFMIQHDPIISASH